jgi:hypothetical protein
MRWKLHQAIKAGFIGDSEDEVRTESGCTKTIVPKKRLTPGAENSICGISGKSETPSALNADRMHKVMWLTFSRFLIVFAMRCHKRNQGL